MPLSLQKKNTVTIKLFVEETANKNEEEELFTKEVFVFIRERSFYSNTNPLGSTFTHHLQPAPE